MNVISKASTTQRPSIGQRLKRAIRENGVGTAASKALAFLVRRTLRTVLEVRRIPGSLLGSFIANFTIEAQIHRRRLYLSSALSREFQGVVRYGPFKSLNLGRKFVWGKADAGSMLLGIYEKEILDVLVAVPKTHKTFIDLGGADGYYATGVLVNGLFSHTYCYELTESGRQNIEYCARLNNVLNRMSIHGKADHDFCAELESAGVDLTKCALLCDIEGGEFDLFDEAILEALRGSYVLIEVHEWHVAGTKKFKKLKEMASRNFEVTELRTGARDLSRYPELSRLHDSDRWLVCSEGRGQLMTWLKLVPK